MIPDSAIAQGMNMKRTKCIEVIKIIANYVSDDLIEKPRTYKLSIIIDETIDADANTS